MLKQIGQVSWLERLVRVLAVSRARKFLPMNTITSDDHDFTYSPRLPIRRSGRGQWLFVRLSWLLQLRGSRGILGKAKG